MSDRLSLRLPLRRLHRVNYEELVLGISRWKQIVIVKLRSCTLGGSHSGGLA
jgi:hypothetical protein